MYITPDSAIPYLLQRGLLTKESLVNDEWIVVQADLKRPVIRVCKLDGLGFILKQASPLDLIRVRLLDREACIYDLAQRSESTFKLDGCLPKLVAYDSGTHTLVTEHLPFDTGWDSLRRPNANIPQIAANLAKLFGACHTLISSFGPNTSLLEPQLPWVLQLNSAEPFGVDRDAMRRLLDFIRAESKIVELLDLVSQAWQVETLIHGDAKLDNVIVRAGEEPKIWLIDWAFCAEGDPAWDIGSMARSAIMLWIFGTRFRKSESFAESAAFSSYPFEMVQQFTRSFFQGYVSLRCFSDVEKGRFATRAIQFAGAAMIQSAFSDARGRNAITLRQVAILQLAISMMEAPKNYSEALFEE